MMTTPLACAAPPPKKTADENLYPREGNHGPRNYANLLFKVGLRSSRLATASHSTNNQCLNASSATHSMPGFREALRKRPANAVLPRFRVIGNSLKSAPPTRRTMFSQQAAIWQGPPSSLFISSLFRSQKRCRPQILPKTAAYRRIATHVRRHKASRLDIFVEKGHRIQKETEKRVVATVG